MLKLASRALAPIRLETRTGQDSRMERMLSILFVLSKQLFPIFGFRFASYCNVIATMRTSRIPSSFSPTVVGSCRGKMILSMNFGEPVLTVA